MKFRSLILLILIGMGAWAEDPRIRIQLTAGKERLAEKPGARPSISFKLEVINTTLQPIDLVAHNAINGDATPEEFILYTEGCINFTVVNPELPGCPYSTGGDFNESPIKELTYRLLPGMPLVFNLRRDSRWYVKDSLFGVSIPIPGMYEIAATIYLQVKGEKDKIKYTSNTQNVSIGGSSERPRNCFARLLAYDPLSDEAFFQADNPDGGNRIGDLFILGGEKRASSTFVFKVTELEKGKFKAVMVEVRGDKNALPKIGSMASIQSEFDRN